jgi:aspartyl-tRNA(Asn)/glutamyl-tRNA(Gln) amidotransferase subunit C
MNDTSPTFDADTVRRIADLARLDVTDEEARALGAQFASILAHFQVLSQLDVEGVEFEGVELDGRGPMLGSSGAVNVLRDDVPVPSFPAETMLAQAPARVGDFYRVPKTVGGEVSGDDESGGRG